MCVLIRATESTALYVQIVGRVMSLCPDKHNALFLIMAVTYYAMAALMM